MKIKIVKERFQLVIEYAPKGCVTPVTLKLDRDQAEQLATMLAVANKAEKFVFELEL